MKLTNLAIDGYRQLQHVSLGQISPTLNVVYGEKGSGKTRISDFVKSILFGDAGSWLSPNEHAPGSVDVIHSSGQYRLTRANSQRLDIQSLATGRLGAATGQAVSLNALVGTLDAEVYQSIFDVSFSHDDLDERKFASLLNRRMNVPVGVEATGDQSAFERSRETANRLNSELESTRQQLIHLQNQRQQYSDEISRIESQVSGQLAYIDSEISRITAAITQLTPASVSTHAIDAEIRELQLRIDNAKPTYVQQPVSQQNLLAGLYLQLDEVDTQLRRWVSVQNDVQQQRIRLKDEMLLWNQMTLESESHPYHKAREILLELESKVDHAQSHTTQWLESHGPVDSQQAATFVGDVCKGMRDDLYRLCNELSQQYKHIRHKSAATELKQLRRCYEEMGENTQRLADRRDTVLTEIRKLDPAGADVISRGETDFCNCAQHEGYLRARQQYVGQIAQPTVHQTLAPDVSAERNRISILEAQRADIHRQTSSHAAQLSRMQADEIALRNQRQGMIDSVETTQLQSQLQGVESELQQSQARVHALEQELQQIPVSAPVAPSPILISAAKLLNRLTDGELTSVWLDTVGPAVGSVDLQVRDRYGKVFNSSALNPSLKNLTRISLVLAAKQQLANAGVEAPLILDEPFNEIDNDRIGNTLDVLSDFSNVGQHQVLLLTQHRFLIDRMSGAKWFDIENRFVAPRPVPRAAPPIAPPIAPPQPVVRQLAPAVHRPLPVAVPPPVTQSKVDWAVCTSGSANSAVTSIGADQIGDRLEYAVSYDETSRLSDIPVFDSTQLRALETSGVMSVAQFLAFAVSEIPRQWAEVGLNEGVVGNLQSEIWLLTCVPALRPTDAHALVACGITEPHQLETSDAQVLYERIERYQKAHENGQTNLEHISRSRISDWHRGLSRTRDRWQNRSQNRSHNGLQSHGRSTSRRSNTDSSNNRSSRGQQRFRDSSNAAPQIRRFSPESDRDNRDRDFDRSRRDGSDRSRRTSHTNENRQPRVAAFDMPNSNGELERQSDYRNYAGDRERSGRERSDGYSSSRHDGRERRDERESRDGRERRDEREARDGRERREERQPRQPRSPRIETPTPERVRRAIPALAPAETRREPEIKPAAQRTKTKTKTKKKDKFYLDLEDHIEAAPSIGPKTAERFEKIGVRTIEQFLNQTAASMAAKLNYKRITEEVARSWQHQARLVCRIPNLRGHDAQILVACNMLEPEDIASMRPEALFDSVGPFSETKEGLKIIRSGKKPDLAEISDWIAWAQKNRSLQAA